MYNTQFWRFDWFCRFRQKLSLCRYIWEMTEKRRALVHGLICPPPSYICCGLSWLELEVGPDNIFGIIKHFFFSCLVIIHWSIGLLYPSMYSVYACLGGYWIPYVQQDCISTVCIYITVNRLPSSHAHPHPPVTPLVSGLIYFITWVLNA